MPGLRLLASSATTAELQQRTVLLACATLLVLALSLGVWMVYSRNRPTARLALSTAGVVALVWVVCGYGLVFGPPLVSGFLGDPVRFLGEGGLAHGSATGLLHALIEAAFYGAVAILAVTIVGSIRAPASLAPWLLFAALWTIVSFAPVAYSIFNMNDGWLFDGLQINDQAGGTAIHVSAGAAALALVLFDRSKRVTATAPGGGRVLWGSLLVWFGAFGLNVGAEGRVDGLFSTIVLNTLIAPAASLVAWVVVEFLMTGRATGRSVALGIVSGVVAITPACNILNAQWAMLLGLLAGAICAAVVTRVRRAAHPGGLDGAGIHLIGGFVGLVFVGILGNGIGWKDSGQPNGIAAQAGAAVGTALWSFVTAAALVWLVRLIFRVAAGRPAKTAERARAR